MTEHIDCASDRNDPGIHESREIPTARKRSKSLGFRDQYDRCSRALLYALLRQLHDVGQVGDHHVDFLRPFS